MHLLEREAQLASLTQYAEEAAGGQGRLVLLAGEAGVGKSSLLDELERRAPGRALGVGCVRRALHPASSGTVAGHRGPARR